MWLVKYLMMTELELICQNYNFKYSNPITFRLNIAKAYVRRECVLAQFIPVLVSVPGKRFRRFRFRSRFRGKRFQRFRFPVPVRFRKAPDTFNFLRRVVRAILSVRPKCFHRCVSLKETPLKPAQILKHTTQISAEQTAMRTKWFKHIAI